jgi:hypothetical protein
MRKHEWSDAVYVLVAALTLLMGVPSELSSQTPISPGSSDKQDQKQPSDPSVRVKGAGVTDQPGVQTPAVRIVSMPPKEFPWEAVLSGIIGLLSAVVAFLIQEKVKDRQQKKKDRDFAMQMLRGILSELTLNESTLQELIDGRRDGRLPTRKVSATSFELFHSELTRLIKSPELLSQIYSLYNQMGYLRDRIDQVLRGQVIQISAARDVADIAAHQLGQVGEVKKAISHILLGSETTKELSNVG